MKRAICFLLLCAGIFSASAQDTYNSSGKANGYKKKQQKGYDPARLVLGGGLNLGYSGDYVNLGISPKVGYKLTDFLAVGVGMGYQYYKMPDFIFDKTNEVVYQHWNIFTPSIWAKCNVYNPIFLSADVEYNAIGIRYYKIRYSGTDEYLEKRKQNVGAVSLLVGAGIKQSLGGRTSGTFEIMYDVLQADYSPYRQQLVYRAGIYVGL